VTGRPRAGDVTTRPNGTLAIRANDGRAQVRLGLRPDQAGSIMLLDAKGKATWRVPGTPVAPRTIKLARCSPSPSGTLP
jgi:hypothetical protein